MSYSAFVQQAAGSAGLPFNSRRSPVYGTKGMVASSQPLATAAGLRILQQGGNAADAAVAVAAALCVTEPCSTGIGGDAFALFYSAKTRKVHCMQGNGASPAALTLDKVREVLGELPRVELPPLHSLTVPVPGAVALWEDALKDWGKLELSQVLGPAIDLAASGFPVSPITAYSWGKGAFAIQQQHSRSREWAALLHPDGRGPGAGELWRNEDLGRVLEGIGERGAREGYYTGPVAEAIVQAVQSRGGVLSLEDLAGHKTARVDPLCTTYRGLTVWEVPPPTAGLVALMALNLLEADETLHLPASLTSKQLTPEQEHPEPHDPTSATSATAAAAATADGLKSHDWLHSAIESCRIAFADGLGYAGDPRLVSVPLEGLLDKQRARQQREKYFDRNKACCPVPDSTLATSSSSSVPQRTPAGDTVQFCVIDGKGNGCSFIQSNYMGFGTGIIPKGCGFTLQNRCHNFSLNHSSPNALGPGKRPYHTIIPGLVTDEGGELLMTFGNMGGFMQPQGHLQVLSSMLDYGLDPQAAVDAPRFCIDKVDSCTGPPSVAQSHVLLEAGFSEEAAEKLRGKGHNVVWPVQGEQRSIFGRAQIILRDKSSGVLCAGSDPRADGCALGW